MTVYVAIMFIVGILRSEKGGTERTCEMFNMILLVASCYITTTQGHSTLCTYEVETTEIVSLAKRILPSIRAINREKLGSDDISTIHAFEAVEMEYGTQCSYKRTLHGFPAG